LSGKVAYIFPGQGAQYAGMGRDLYDSFPQAKEIFEEASDILRFDLKALCFQGPVEKLSTTAFSQPAILTVSIAALRAMEAQVKGLDVGAALGLSLGEYSALVSAGSIGFKEALELVGARGRLMEEASRERPGKMASVLGLNRDTVDEICGEAGCEIANLNCPDQIVISGKTESINRAMDLAKERGAKRSIILDVSGPFHSSLMKSAADRLSALLNNIAIKKPVFPVVSNVDASYETDTGTIKKNLLTQLTSRTYWEDSIKFLVEKNIRTFLEIGPGKILRGLLRRIDPGLTVHNVGTTEDISNLRGAI